MELRRLHFVAFFEEFRFRCTVEIEYTVIAHFQRDGLVIDLSESSPKIGKWLGGVGFLGIFAAPRGNRDTGTSAPRIGCPSRVRRLTGIGSLTRIWSLTGWRIAAWGIATRIDLSYNHATGE